MLRAQADALERVRGAEGEATNRVATATAQAARFTNQIPAYQAAPEVYPPRLYLQTLARASAGARKYLVPPPTPTKSFNSISKTPCGRICSEI